MRRVPILLALCAAATSPASAFSLNADQDALRHITGRVLLKDLAVGESAFMYPETACSDENGDLFMPSNIHVSSRNEHSYNLKVTRATENALEAEFVKGTEANREDLLYALEAFATISNCHEMQSGTVFNLEPMRLTTINGHADMLSLLNEFGISLR